jgi:phenylpropionate dioxygenase-like ring-hydroxylating dioxygenase large terminal subunit
MVVNSCSSRPFYSVICFLLILCVRQFPLYGFNAYSWTAPFHSRIRSNSCSLRFSSRAQLRVNSVVFDQQEDEKLQLSRYSGLLGAWIPVGSASALAPLSPTSVTIMNRDFAVWQDKLTSRWSVLLDECPHRLAPLSQGRINPKSGCIECPYHGWEFDDQGRNKNIPQWQSTEDAFTKAVSDPKSKLHATSFPVHLSGDLIFTFLPTSFHNESFPITLTPEDMYDGLSSTTTLNRTFFVRDLPYSFDFLVENFFCPAHIPFAHHGLQGVRDDGSPIPMKIIVNNFTTVEVEYQDRIRNKTRQ